MLIRERYNAKFLKELAQLNPAQRQAVEQIEGPVLVIAGPGTGKTHILSARIGRILLETDTQPYNILCLTFTDAGVRAMRERLLHFIGPEAHRVHIYTFHSFCNNIIQDNPIYFGATPLEPISELEQVELIQELLNELPALHPLKRGRGNPYFYLQHLLDLFQIMKREHWSVTYMEQQIIAYSQELPNKKEFIYQVNHGKFQKGDLKEAKLEEEQLKMEQLLAAAHLFPIYQKKMKRARRYDYDDMILWVLHAFEKKPALLRRYQEQYLYFLVDEYQDTNGAQNQVLQRLMDFWEVPNVFIVGDDDQSIYEFQGARLKNIREFYEKYEAHLQLIVLTNNYRSTQPILDTASGLIERNEKRLLNDLQVLGLQKKLIATHKEFSQLKIQPQIIEFPNRLQEDLSIVQQIETAWQEKFPLNDIAIIYAQHRQIENILYLLEKKGIPYNVKRRVNILNLPIIWNLRLLLQYLAAEYEQPYSGEHLLYQLLHVDFLNIHVEDIASVSIHLVQENVTGQKTWRSVIEEIGQKKLKLHLQEPSAWQAWSAFLSNALEDYRNHSLPVLLERIINRSGLLHFILQHPEQIWLTQVLRTFFDFVRDQTYRYPQLNVKGLLDLLKNMENNRIPLAVSKLTTAEEGVNLLTAHSSKGLEFQKVFIIDCVKDYWEPKKRGGNFQFTFPETLTFSNEEDEMEARRRLFYVSMTRAKAQLHLSYSQQDRQEKSLQRALFIDEIIQENTVFSDVQQKTFSDKELLKVQHLLLSETEKPIIQPFLDKTVVNQLIEDFRLSISSLNTYLACSLSFFYQYVLRIPTLQSEAASYGEAMHRALQIYHETMLNRKNKTFPSLNQLLKYFEEEMKRTYRHFSANEFQRRLDMGKQNLTHYYNVLKTGEKEVKIELNLRQVEVSGVPITGTIDKIEFLTPTTANIVDYKTGKSSTNQLKRADEKNPYGGTYYRQLTFYKLLYENYRPTSSIVKQGTIIFLDPSPQGKYKQSSITFNSKDSAFMRNLIKDTYENIKSHQFYEGCGEKNCIWCNFVKKNKLMDSLADFQVESLDD